MITDVMPSPARLPIVAIVGRPNVGKSALFNWLAGRRISIVDPTAGVTRDRVSVGVESNDRFFELMDTGGMGIEDCENLSRAIGPVLDVADLLNSNNHLEIAGVWAWAMAADALGVSGLATTAGDAIKTALNSTLAAGSLPSDPNAIVNSILGVLGGNFFSLLGSGLASIVPFLGDDAIGSRMYIGLGVTGTLQGIIDASVGTASFPSLALPLVSDPPDIDGGAIFSLGSKTFSNQVMTNGGVQGKHTYTYTLTQS